MYATHPAAIHHGTDWLRALLAGLIAVALTIILTVAVNLPQATVTPVAPAQPMTMTEMQQRAFQLDHHADIYGTTAQQLQMVFQLEHQADLQP